jgi:hypothetical protein
MRMRARVRVYVCARARECLLSVCLRVGARVKGHLSHTVCTQVADLIIGADLTYNRVMPPLALSGSLRGTAGVLSGGVGSAGWCGYCTVGTRNSLSL